MRTSVGTKLCVNDDGGDDDDDDDDEGKKEGHTSVEHSHSLLAWLESL